jgi:hypothetical protein
MSSQGTPLSGLPRSLPASAPGRGSDQGSLLIEPAQDIALAPGRTNAPPAVPAASSQLSGHPSDPASAQAVRAGSRDHPVTASQSSTSAGGDGRPPSIVFHRQVGSSTSSRPVDAEPAAGSGRPRSGTSRSHAPQDGHRPQGSGGAATFNDAVYGAGHPWAYAMPASSRVASAPSANPSSGLPGVTHSQEWRILDQPIVGPPPYPPPFPPQVFHASDSPVERQRSTFPPPGMGSQVRPPSEAALDNSLRSEIAARFARGEHLVSLESLRVFIRDFGQHFTGDQAHLVAGLISDRQALARFAGLDPALGSTGASVSQGPAAASGPPLGTCLTPDAASVFIDFDGFSHVCDSKSAAAVSAANSSFNENILRWRFLGPRLDAARVILCSPTSPFVVDFDAFREWIAQEGSVISSEDRHPLLQGMANASLWSAFAFLGDMHWLNSSRLFSGLASVNLGSFSKRDRPRLHAGLFYRVGGVSGDRDVASRAFLDHVVLPSFSGSGIVTCFITCLAGVLLCPELIREAQSQGLEDRFLAGARVCSHQVSLMQFWKKAVLLVDILSASHRGSLVETSTGSGVSLAALFQARTGVAEWFIGGLAAALEISEGARWPVAKTNATEWLLRSCAPSGAAPASTTSAPTPSGAARPCVYGFLETFRPQLNFSCRVASCQYSHDFTRGEDAYVEAVKAVVNNAAAGSGLAAQKSAVLASLASSA